jgi:hypothetical protein
MRRRRRHSLWWLILERKPDAGRNSAAFMRPNNAMPIVTALEEWTRRDTLMSCRSPCNIESHIAWAVLSRTARIGASNPWAEAAQVAPMC